jgi:uncharacterized protein (TIGR00730 family)
MPVCRTRCARCIHISVYGASGRDIAVRDLTLAVGAFATAHLISPAAPSASLADMFKAVCVFAGSSPGASPSYAQQARSLAKALVRRGVTIVYGGARVGLMGELADAALTAGGQVVGVIPEGIIAREVAHPGLSDLRLVRSMHERKALMNELSDAFIALPGGLGTLEELFEVLTWLQLGLHQKPIGLFDATHYFASLREFLAHSVRERFVRAEHAALLLSESDPDRLLDALAAWQAPPLPKWLDRRET